MTNTNKDTIGVLLLNLGGPDSLQAVKPFLYNLFSDREVIRLGPSFMQKPMAWLISTLRSFKTRQMYSLIGGKSPILDITMAQALALEKALNSLRVTRYASHVFKVYIGMRYWHPFIEDTVDKILKDRVKHIIVLSLYPHYSKATTGSAIAEFKRAIAKFCPPPSPSRGEDEGGGDIKIKYKYIEQWYNFPPYIEALAELIVKGISEFTTLPDILYSAHSLPEKLIKEGDPYLEHIKATITAVNSSLVHRLSSIVKWHLSFQSKSGPVKWLKPTTEETIIKLANEGCKDLFVVPISFVSDHIETLYEIDILYKELTERHGINFKRCEALNTSEKFIEALKELVMKETQISANICEVFK